MLRSRGLRPSTLSTGASEDFLAVLHSPGSDTLPPTTMLPSPKSRSPVRVTLRRHPSALRLKSSSLFKRGVLACILVAACLLLLLLYNNRFRESHPAMQVVQHPAHPGNQKFGALKQKFASSPARTVHEALLDAMVEKHEEQGIPTTTDIVNLRWPPIVTAVPEAPPSHDATRIGVTTAAIDAQFCYAERCRILLPLWIGEQESRGRMHLTQLIHLAVALNRTLVLPNVGKSRLGTCGKWTFEAYYDVGSLARQVKEVGGGTTRVMLMDDFKTWIDMRPDAPQGQVLFFQEGSITEEIQQTSALLTSAEGLNLFIDNHVLAPNDPRLKNTFCLKTKYRGLLLDQHLPQTMYLTPPDPLNVAATTPSGELMAGLLTQHLGGPSSRSSVLPVDTQPNQYAARSFRETYIPSEPDVLLLHWDFRHLPFTPAPTLPPLRYADKLWEFSQQLTQPYQPYLAVHWRMETVEPALLPDCAEALVDTMNTLLSDPTLAKGIQTVWLATDVPWSSTSDGALLRSPAQRSNTFKAFTEQHTQAIRIVKGAFEREGSLAAWKLTGLGEEVQRVRNTMQGEELVLAYEDDLGMLWEDSGVWGILDKMAAMRSALFVSATRNCGRVRYVRCSRKLMSWD